MTSDIRRFPEWRMDATKVLTRREIATVLADLRRPRALKDHINRRVNLMVFRLATCCGLRCSEIAKLKIRHVKVGPGLERPHLLLDSTVTKMGRPRMVPLWWDTDTLHDIESWLEERVLSHGAAPDDYVICRVDEPRNDLCLPADESRPVHRSMIWRRFRTACSVLGPARLDTLTIHHGRHSFISHALAGGRTLAEVRDAAGHSSVNTTSHYTHVVADDGKMGNTFAFNGHPVVIPPTAQPVPDRGAKGKFISTKEVCDVGSFI